MGVRKLDLVLLEKQTDRFTPETSLGVNDFCDVLEPPTITMSPDVDIDARGSSTFDMYAPTVGRINVEIGLKFALHSLGSGGNPDFIRCLECAGWERRLDNGYIVMAPISEIVHACTVWAYTGGPGTQKSMLEKFGNIMFDGSIAFEAGKRAVLTLTGKGVYLAKPIRATMPNVASLRERVVSPPLMAAGITINGKAYGFIKGDLTFGQAVESGVDPTQAFGGGDTEITDRKMEASASVYQKIDSNLIPHDNLMTGTSGLLQYLWGSVYHYPDLKIKASAQTLIDVKPGNQNGVNTWELKSVLEKNDVELHVYNGTGSSYSSASTSASSDSNSSGSGSSASDSSGSNSSSSKSV